MPTRGQDETTAGTGLDERLDGQQKTPEISVFQSMSLLQQEFQTF